MWQSEREALTVSQLNEYARRLVAGDALLRGFVVTGEITGYKHHYSGHRYFSLKDEKCRVQCVMFRQNAVGLEFEPQDGMRVQVRASASIYERDGSFQLYCYAMTKVGQGELYARFEKLKQKLLAEGLMDPARKRDIPAMPRIVGVATSRTGAAIRDIVQVARRRNPNVGILLAPCAVQGEGAAQEIVRAIQRLNENGESDVILVGRGGGSIEDLWAFNEEIVARAIAASRIPVISCVGHEIDFTIADFVADLRAPTPSAAAELAVPELAALKQDLSDMLSRVAGALQTGQRLRRLQLEKLSASQALARPVQSMIEPRRQRLSQLAQRLDMAMPAIMKRERHRLDALAASLRALNPESVLERGYAVVRQGNAIVTKIGAVKADAPIRVRMADGELSANVTGINVRNVENDEEDHL